MIRPFRILGVHHVAIGNAEQAKLQALWCDALGLEIESSHRIEQENTHAMIARLGNGPLSVELDLLQPLDAEKKPSPHLPPLNHVGLWVDHLAEAVTWLTTQGVRFAPGGIRKGADGREIAFIHPKANDEFPIGGAGVMIELVQATPEVIAAFTP